jgi:hypothetical protein
MALPPLKASELDRGPDHAADAESEEVDVLGCVSDDPPSAEEDVRSGVPVSDGSDGSGVVTALNTFSKAAVSRDSWSREFLSTVCTLSPTPCSLIGRLAASALTTVGRGIGGTSSSPLLNPEFL